MAAGVMGSIPPSACEGLAPGIGGGVVAMRSCQPSACLSRCVAVSRTLTRSGSGAEGGVLTPEGFETGDCSVCGCAIGYSFGSVAVMSSGPIIDTNLGASLIAS